MNLKQAITTKARYDPYSDKILDCKKGSKEWHHEDRHRQQYSKIPKTLFIQDLVSVYSRYMFAVTFVLHSMVPIYPLRVIALISLTTLIISTLFELGIELDAEFYSWRKESESKRR